MIYDLFMRSKIPKKKKKSQFLVIIKYISIYIFNFHNFFLNTFFSSFT